MYEENDLPKFQQVVKLIENKIMPIVRAHAMSGHARINTEDELLNDETALRILIDILSERGYHATIDIHKMEVPTRINPDTWEIICRTKKIFRIELRYQASEIRRGH
jgi:adenylate kinase